MYTEAERLLYTFPNSARQADPLELRRKLTLHTGGRLAELVSAYNDGDTELARAEAEDKLVAAARLAFGLQPATATAGSTDATVLEYLAHFLEWLSTPPELNSSRQPTGRPCTGCK